MDNPIPSQICKVLRGLQAAFSCFIVFVAQMSLKLLEYLSGSVVFLTDCFSK